MANVVGSGEGGRVTALVNKARLAKALGCSKPTLDALIDRYPDFPILRQGSNGRDWHFDLAAVQKFLDAKRGEQVAAQQAQDELLSQISFDFLEQPTTPSTGLSPRDQRQLVQAERERIKLGQEKGLLVMAPAVQAAATVFCSDLAQFLDALPQAIGRQFNLPDQVIQAMRATINDKRRHMVSELTRKLTASRVDERPSSLF